MAVENLSTFNILPTFYIFHFKRFYDLVDGMRSQPYMQR